MGADMNSHTVHHGFSLGPLRAALHLPRFNVTPASRLPAQSGPSAGLMEQLASWAERQPPHHRMGSYTQRP
jgi:hypothetical protein